MAYATRSDIEAKFGARHLETLVAVDVDMDAAVATAIEAAQATIDSFLRKRYVLPITVPTPAILKQCAIDIACWELAPAADRMSEEIEKRAKLRMDFLLKISRGDAEIVELTPVAGGGDGSGSAVSGGGAAFSAEPRRWSGELE